MNLYPGSKTKDTKRLELSEKFFVKIGIQQGMCRVFTNFRDCSRCNYCVCKRRLDEENFVCVYNLVLMSKTIENSTETFLKRKKLFMSSFCL